MNKSLLSSARLTVLKTQIRGHVRIPHWEYHIRFSPQDGRKVPSQDVLDRFKRLNTGMWIRAKPGRRVKRYLKQEPWLSSSLEHVTCTPLECQILDKLVNRFWLRPRYYVDDPYEKYNARRGISGCQPNSLWMRPESRRKILLDHLTEREFF